MIPKIFQIWKFWRTTKKQRLWKVLNTPPKASIINPQKKKKKEKMTMNNDKLSQNVNQEPSGAISTQPIEWDDLSDTQKKLVSLRPEHQMDALDAALRAQAADHEKIMERRTMELFKYFHGDGKTEPEGKPLDRILEFLRLNNDDKDILLRFAKFGPKDRDKLSELITLAKLNNLRDRRESVLSELLKMDATEISCLLRMYKEGKDFDESSVLSGDEMVELIENLFTATGKTDWAKTAITALLETIMDLIRTGNADQLEDSIMSYQWSLFARESGEYANDADYEDDCLAVDKLADESISNYRKTKSATQVKNKKKSQSV